VFICVCVCECSIYIYLLHTHTHAYNCVSRPRVCLFYSRFRAPSVKSQRYTLRKKSSLPAPGKISRSCLYLRTHTLTYTHTRTSHTGSSHSLSLSHSLTYIYYIILPHAKMNGLRLTVVECNMCMCRQWTRIYVCVCVAPPVWLCYKNDVCVCFGIKRVCHRLVETPCAAGDMSLSAFHSTPLPPQINNGLLSYVFLVLSCMCPQRKSQAPDFIFNFHRLPHPLGVLGIN